VNKGKKVLKDRLTALGIAVLDSDTNFMYFKLSNNLDSKKVVEKLMEKNILIKSPLNVEPFTPYLRTTVGDADQMEYFCAELQRTIESMN